MKYLYASETAKQILGLLILAIVGILMVFVVATVLHADFSTMKQATAQITSQYSECEDHLELAEVTFTYGFTGPLSYPITAYFLQCKEVDISIRIQKP